jgi:hypothetical protein
LSTEIPSKSRSTSRNSTGERRSRQSSAVRRSVSFADQVNVLNDDEEPDLPQDPHSSLATMSNEQDIDENLSSTSFMNSSSLIITNQLPVEDKFNDSDYYSLTSSPSFQQQQQQQQQQQYDQPTKSKSNLPSKYRLPVANEVLINKMDSNLRMLIIKELSKSGHAERPISRMSKSLNNLIPFLKDFRFRLSLW